MAQPYVGEIRMVGFSFPPVGWAFCNGAPMPISEYDTLFTLIGTTYGGDGQETFNLPNLSSRVPLHMGSGFQIGDLAGTEQETISVQQTPKHTHPLTATSSLGTATNPVGQILAQSSTGQAYQLDTPNTNLNGQAVSIVGGSQPHDNLQPYLAISFVISLFGIFPSQT
jgi:microcystin-dependent protein